MCSALLLLTVSSQLVASFSFLVWRKWFQSLLVLFVIHSYACILTETMPRIFQGYSECRFHGSENDRYYLKIAKSQHKHAQENKRGRWITYFLDNTAKTCSYRPKISENLEIKHVFQSKSFFFSSLYFSPHMLPLCLFVTLL